MSGFNILPPVRGKVGAGGARMGGLFQRADRLMMSEP